jgi:hypothetical protein
MAEDEGLRGGILRPPRTGSGEPGRRRGPLRARRRNGTRSDGLELDDGDLLASSWQAEGTEMRYRDRRRHA